MRRMSRRVVAAVVTASVAGAVLVGASGASAAQQRDESLGGLITEFETFTIGGMLRLDQRTGRTSLAGLRAVTGLVDQAENLIGSLTSVPMSLPRESGPDIGTFSCIRQGSARNFLTFDPTELYYNDKRGIQQYQFHPYRKTGARKMVNRQMSTQYEVCGTGGMDLKDGHRAFKAGLGFAFPDTAKTYRIGHKWESGKTPADYSLSMGFQLGNDKTPLSIGASMTQNPSDKLMGSFNGPYKSSFDAYARNAVNAWWQDSCVSGWTRCTMHADGSPNFQGTIAHGLYEFRPEEARKVNHFAVTTYLKSACQSPFDVGC